MANCTVCFRHCALQEGQTGFCGGRSCQNGVVRAGNYGRVTALALDPIEKKPLSRFYPGSRILSVGSYGCNLRCPFCQNFQISWDQSVKASAKKARTITPEQLVDLALSCRDRDNIGLAFTYNEPLIGYEYVRDTAKLAHEAGLVTVLVTNGTAELSVLEELGPYIDAMNIDLKGFTDRYYRHVLGGDFAMVRAFIARGVQLCHVELTTLIVPGENDTEDELRQMTRWIAGLKTEDGRVIGPSIPLHISRFFPRFHYSDHSATSVDLVYHLAQIAREQLEYVYTGNC